MEIHGRKSAHGQRCYSKYAPTAAIQAFGQVTERLEVVDAIWQVKTGNKVGHGDVPLETVFIRSM